MTTRSSIGMQRIGPLSGLAGLLAARGVGLSTLLEGLPVTEADFQPERQMPIGVISAVLERAAALPGLAEVGLLLGAGQNHTALGAAGQLMASCATLGSALGTYAALQIANSTAAAVYLHPAGEDYAFGFGVYARELPSSHIYDVSAAIGRNMVQDLTGGAVRPLEVLLSRPVPPAPEAYRRFFQCPVRFNEHQSCLILPGRAMGFKLPSADAALRERLLLGLQQQVLNLPQGVAARVKHALLPMLLAGTASHREVAAHLNMHPRTLGRRLEEEGATFEQLKDEVRHSVARELLIRTETAVGDVAAALGYATPSAFVRAFRRWTGGSPSALRRAARRSA